MLSEFSNSSLSLLPPLSAILLAVFTRRVLFSIGFGTVLGALMLYQFDVFTAGHYLSDVVRSNFNFENSYIVIFLLLMGVMMQLMLCLGASKAFAQWVFKHMKTRRSAKWIINVMALVFFIDDYLHSLLAGNISRPIADQYRISRAKLAYLLDSTAATLCVIIPLSSWGGYIIGLIAAILATHHIQDTSAFSAFMQTTPMMFYVWFTLLIVAFVSHFNINVGPMAAHEQRALSASQSACQTQGQSADEGVSLVWVLAPIAMTTLVTLATMLWTGAAGLRAEGRAFEIFAAFEQTKVGLSICAGGFTGVLLLTCVCVQRMTCKTFFQQSYLGIKAMMPAIIILLFAWSIGTVVNAMGTGQYLSNIAQAYISPAWLPCLLFVLAGFMALATGTSLGTFGIMLPLAADIAVATDVALLFPVMAAVLCGAVFGDHCSPISDTTILSASGAGCDHMDHVVTQAPYAIFGAFLSAISFIALGFTQSTGLSFLVGFGVLLAVVCLLMVRSEKKILCHSA